MHRTALSTALAATFLTLAVTAPALARSSCMDGERKIDEANALRYQARQEARIGNQGRVCDTLDEVGDRYHDAQDAFEDCDAGAIAISLRSELRALKIAKRANLCD